MKRVKMKEDHIERMMNMDADQLRQMLAFCIGYIKYTDGFENSTWDEAFDMIYDTVFDPEEKKLKI